MQFFIKNVSTIRSEDRSLDLPEREDKVGPRIKGWLKDIMFGAEQHEWGVVVEE